MSFKLVYHSQTDPEWGSKLLGTGTTTLSYEGCAVSSVAMLLSGYGFYETPQSLNEHLKVVHGFSNGSGIVWGAVSALYPNVKADPRFTITAADLRKMDEELTKGKPVVVGVDRKIEEGFQSHYVLVYARTDNDYLMLDPIYRPGADAKSNYLMARYSYDRPILDVIKRLVFYEAPGADGRPISPLRDLPAPPALQTHDSASQHTPAPSPESPALGRKSKLHVTVQKNGLQVYATNKGKGRVLSTENKGNQLVVLDAGKATAIIGKAGKWLKVKASNGERGFVDAGSVKVV